MTTQPATVTPIGTIAPLDLDDATPDQLADAVRSELAAVTAAHSRALRHTWRAGDLLTRAKRALPHGEWIPWIESVELEPRTAQRLLAVRRHCPSEEAATGYRSASHLLADARSKLARQGALQLDAEAVTKPPAPITATAPTAPARFWERVAAWIAQTIERLQALTRAALTRP